MKYSLITLLFFCFNGLLHAQTANVTVNLTFPSVALLDVEPNTENISFTLSAPTDAGQAIQTVASNSSKWLNFSSAVGIGVTRRITAQYTGTLPAGVGITLSTANYVGSGAGTLGTAVPIITLSTAAQTIVNSIGGAFTGNGGSTGYNLTFAPILLDYASLRSQSATITVIYTLIDN
ncbi:MAG: hypothetical protein ACK4R6_09130 [Spirosomataceae bacterium]